jgi:hypothetical protein
MIFPAPLAKSLLMAASIGLVVPVLAQRPAANRSASAGSGQVAEEEPAIVGVEAKWAQGLLGLAVEGNAFVLRFYDKDKKPVPVPVARAAARWSTVTKARNERVILNQAGEALRSPAVVRAPLTFVVHLTLLDEAGDVLGMASFDLRGLSGADGE